MSVSQDPHTDLDPRITVQSRSWAAPQTVRDAAVYALRAPYDLSMVFSQTRPAQLRAELEAHLSVLRDNDDARLILTARLLPGYDATDGAGGNALPLDIDAAKIHLSDMSLLQLANDRELELADLSELVRSVGDNNGHLVLKDEMPARSTSRDQAFEIRYQRGMP